MDSGLFSDVCRPNLGVNTAVLDQVLHIAVEIAREGREGHKIGTLFTVGDEDEVIRHSRPLVLDPLYGHPPEKKLITHTDVRETLKELAQLDGAFVISNSGVAISAARYIDVRSQGTKVPLGLGSRHMAAASITRQTSAVAVVVSESAIVRVFDDGQIISEILPELWMLRQHGVLMDHHSEVSERVGPNVLVRTREAEAGVEANGAK